MAGSEVKLLVFECISSGMYAKTASTGNKKRQLLVFSELSSLVSAAADRAVSAIPLVVSRVANTDFTRLVRLFKDLGRTIQLPLIF
jgi:hypothetical protein